MEYLVKQLRVRFSGIEQGSQEDANTSTSRRLPPQKTQSFKGVKKAQNWFRRQFSGQMSQENDSSESSEFATVVAAAAFAINSLDEAISQHPKKALDRSETSLNKTKSRKDDATAGLPEPGRVSRRFSDKEAKIDKQSPGETSLRKSEVADQRMPDGHVTSPNMPERGVGSIPTIKKTPTFDMGRTKQEKQVDTRTTVHRTFSRSGSQKQEMTSTTEGDPKADAWEQAEIARIQKKYERTTSTIVSWENEKKAKAKQRLDKKESEIERRRVRTLQSYRQEIERINQIASGAKAVAEERRRNEESKAQEKAKKIRSTGKVPTTCCCF